MNNVRVLSGKEQERMTANGWFIVFAKRHESDDQLKDRLSQKFSKVKIYYTTTYVRGYYNTIAMVKGVQS